MRKLQPLVDRFVHDLLAAMRAAAIAQLAPSGAAARAAPTQAAQMRRTAGERAKARSTARKPCVAPPTRASFAVMATAEHEAAPAAEITDPMRLLDVAAGRGPGAVTSSQPDPTAVACDACAQPETALPERPTERKEAVVVTLRPNETLVRATTAGLVIRRARG